LSYPRPFRGSLRNAQYLDLRFAKLPRGLRYIERASSASGREARLPLLDPRIVQLGFEASPSAKIGQGQLRRFMKDSARAVLPRTMLDPNKRSVADPQRQWLRNELSGLVSDVFGSSSFRSRGIFDDARVAAAYRSFRKGDEEQNSLGIFQAFIVEMWFRTVISA
jgi:asparagine synthase (glutamine-hydrolysing)